MSIDTDVEAKAKSHPIWRYTMCAIASAGAVVGAYEKLRIPALDAQLQMAKVDLAKSESVASARTAERNAYYTALTTIAGAKSAIEGVASTQGEKLAACQQERTQISTVATNNYNYAMQYQHNCTILGEIRTLDAEQKAMIRRSPRFDGALREADRSRYDELAVRILDLQKRLRPDPS
ncbi:hypothetical protein QWZ03_18285 [Chitinimonas viridis]|uniref:Uncharacterized protein n=1 Tax=Chitinimonas viridis TaxID=664880 RepID=A0ABT8B9K6_9NEIS|nr:hypothetical protein [Chitinimonas viridis]MDN3578719.1 hypothetical protein [Chitinimonas viridis]